MTHRPLLQITIPTYRRPEELGRLLASLVEQGYGDFSGDLRILVSENGGSEGASSIVANCQQKLPVQYIKQPFAMGSGLHIMSLYAQVEAEYLWLIGDDDWVALPWASLRGMLASKNLDFLRLGGFREQPDFTCIPESDPLETAHLQGDSFGKEFLVDNWLAMTFISTNLMRTDWFQPALPHVDFRNAYFPVEIVLRAAAAGCRGKFIHGKCVVGGHRPSWEDRIQEYVGVHLPAVADNMRKVYGMATAKRMMRGMMDKNAHAFRWLAKREPGLYALLVLRYLPEFAFHHFPRRLKKKITPRFLARRIGAPPSNPKAP